MNNQIRYATINDATGITSLIRDIGWFMAINQLSVEEAKKKIEIDLNKNLSEPESHSVYVSEGKNGFITGYISVHWISYMILIAPEGYVSELFIHPTHRNQGIGGALLDVVIDEARSRSCLRLSLLNVHSRESYQRQFYKKQGWIEREGISNFIFPIMPD